MGVVTRPRPLPCVVYWSISAMVIGFWLTAGVISVPQNLNIVQFPTSVADSDIHSTSSATQDDAVASPGFDISFTQSGTISSVEFEEELDETRVISSNPISPVDLLEVDHVTLQRTLPKLYHSPHVFSLNYEEMWNRLQIWIYPSQYEDKYEHRYEKGEDVAEELSSTADFFFRLLARSEFVTENPDEAQLFLLPVSIDVLWVDLGPARVAEQLRRYLQQIRDAYPYWSLSLGADHFYLSCHAFGQSKHRNILELGKNAIQVACSPLRHNQVFYPHKDVVFPQYKPVAEREIHAALAEKTQRTRLAYFGASLDVDSALVSVFDEWKTDPDIEIEADPTPHLSSTYRKLASSRFCVIVAPQDTLNLVDALRFGCVPVLISKSVLYDLPFQEILNWHEFSVVLPMKDLPKLKYTLNAIPAKKYQQMQYLGHQASKHMEWNNPPIAYDAFHMTLVELWVRRHSIKYARREYP